jgi:hypothetical protein
MKLRITAPRMNGLGTEVYLDDKRLAYVTAVKVELGWGSANSATITFCPTEVDLEGQFDAARGEEARKCEPS